MKNLLIVVLLAVTIVIGGEVIARTGWTVSFPWWIWPACIVFVYFSVYIHEFGHALAAWTVGFPVKRITVGGGAEIMRRRVGETVFVLKGGLLFPVGMVHMGSVSERCLKPRFFVFASGGVLFQGFAVAIAVALSSMPVKALFSLEITSLVQVFVYSNLMMIVINLLPLRANLFGVKTPTDGFRLFFLPFMSPVEIQDVLSSGEVFEGFELFEAKRFPEAEQRFRECLEAYPKAFIPKIDLAAALIKQMKLDEAILLLESQRRRYERDPNIGLLYGNLAWAYFLKGTEKSFQKADEYSLKAIELSPKHATVEGTRGSVLIEKGDLDEGIKLVRKHCRLWMPVDDQLNDPVGFMSLAYAYYRKGDTKKALKYLSKLATSKLPLDQDTLRYFDHVHSATDDFARCFVPCCSFS